MICCKYIIMEVTNMDVIYKVSCGIDVHKNKLVACLKIKGKKDVIKEYSGQTEDIKSMANWLKENKCEKLQWKVRHHIGSH